MVLEEQPVASAGIGPELDCRRPPRIGPLREQGPALLGVDPVTGLEVGTVALNEPFGVLAPIKVLRPLATFVVAVAGYPADGPGEPSLSFRCRF